MDVKVDVEDKTSEASDIERKENISIVKRNYDAPYDFGDLIFLFISYAVILLTFPISIWSCIKVVRQYEKSVLFRLGKLRREASTGPGLRLVIPCTDQLHVIDMRTKSFDVPSQEILTKAGLAIGVDSVVFYRIFDAEMSVTNIENADEAAKLLAQTTLRNVLGTKSLQQILVDREQIARDIGRLLDRATDPWGIKIFKIEFKDLRIPTHLQRSMAAEAEATREARAKVIQAGGEMNASLKLKEAAEVLSAAKPAAMQLRYLHTLLAVSAEKNKTYIVPVPYECLENMIR